MTKQAKFPQQDWSGCRILVIGAARQGLALANYFINRNARVVLNDLRPLEELAGAQAALADLDNSHPGALEWACGSHPVSLLDGVAVVCVSGGVPLELPLIVEARCRGIPLTNDSQIFLENAPCDVVGITGSAGKTTTTTLVGRMIQASNSYRQVWVGGNIGTPLISQLQDMTADDLAVMELSSFQLEIMDRSPEVAAVLNVTPNHLDRHETMEAYTAAKAHILDYQDESGIAILGRDDPGAWSLAQSVHGQLLTFGLDQPPIGQPGSYYQNGELFLTIGGQPSEMIMQRSEIQLRGEHNLLNVLAACAIAAAARATIAGMRAGVAGFRGVAHRLEYIRNWSGAEWYNDSIATAPERSMAAIRSFSEPLVLLAGGRDKKLPWDDFARLVVARVNRVILFGESAGKILAALEQAWRDFEIERGSPAAKRPLTIHRCQSLSEATAIAARVAQPGDVVLLSPGGTSFDEFRDFEERGECFARWVRELQ